MIATPYLIAFRNIMDDVLFMVIEIAVCVLFGLDIVIQLNTSYYDSQNELVTEYKQIALNY
jgi:hypothetical protein